MRFQEKMARVKLKSATKEEKEDDGAKQSSSINYSTMSKKKQDDQWLHLSKTVHSLYYNSEKLKSVQVKPCPLRRPTQNK